jgi:hypothetical protein
MDIAVLIFLAIYLRLKAVCIFFIIFLLFRQKKFLTYAIFKLIPKIKYTQKNKYIASCFCFM